MSPWRAEAIPEEGGALRARGAGRPGASGWRLTGARAPQGGATGRVEGGRVNRPGQQGPHRGFRSALRAPAHAAIRRAPQRGPFVYRLGRQVFNLKRGVRLP